MNGKFFGKYRGTVSSNEDPLFIGRIQANVPDVTGLDNTGWAMPCFPFGGGGSVFFALPALGAGVWIEFEHGDPDYPIWSGCWFGSVADLPLAPPPYQKVLIQSAGGNSILLDDTPGIGGITLQTAAGQKISLSATGIQIDNGLGGTISLVGPKVAINNDALEVLF